MLECGCQATGGNFSGFRTLRHDGRPLGFPLAELAADCSCVVTKHPDTGGAVTVDTVTAQLLYEVQSTRYLNPDTGPKYDNPASYLGSNPRVAWTIPVDDQPADVLVACEGIPDALTAAQAALMQAEILNWFIEGGLNQACLWALNWKGGTSGFSGKMIINAANGRPWPVVDVMELFSRSGGDSLLKAKASVAFVPSVSAC